MLCLALHPWVRHPFYSLEAASEQTGILIAAIIRMEVWGSTRGAFQ